ncbi:unnamed protein product [Gongylonema pulchrum]|uniref:FIST_C domain-containing protein n=1 Tax=Gongylonema pulchrum TaxID=637853 RepID=A0A183EGY0_9BILA|nr:unnamed protein product [Gongylonema pulchrum]
MHRFGSDEMDAPKLLVGLICSDAELVEYYVRLITEIKRFCLKASKKKAICIGAAALSEQTALLLMEFAQNYQTFLRIIYPLRYSAPMLLIKANIGKIGAIQSISAEATFQEPLDAKHLLYNDCDTVLHQVSHGLIDALSDVCSCRPEPIATTCRQRSSLVEHFRLQQLQCVHMQIAFGTAVASIRVAAHDTRTLQLQCVHMQIAFGTAVASIRVAAHDTRTLVLQIVGELGFIQLDPRMLVLEGREGQGVLWRGDGTMESIIRTGLIKAMENCDSGTNSSISNELVLVRCVSNCRFI